MKFSVGYPVDDSDGFAESVEEHREHIEEVYFAWPGVASCRMSSSDRAGYVLWDTQERLEADLLRFRRAGVKLDLLFNGNCYGGQAVSRKLERLVCSIIDHLQERVGGVEVVTTTSPFVAFVVKNHYESIEVRASVNMRIGTVEGMAYLEDVFDSFYIQREYNRDFERIGQLRQWAQERGKRLHMLANSGCLRFCSTQTFHDNMVAHEQQIAETINVPCEALACRSYLRNPDNWAAILQATWVRPEDIGCYEDYFPVIKLATRMHHNPAMVIRAYVQRRHRGNLLNLLEPSHGPLLQGHIIDNRRFPQDWFEHVTKCSK
ncbi:MAG: hypothetical protein K8S55_11780, partial [Phycisphaerae bacterium]|nr:hypothetical protein [Phycisphaerae bacterium]